MSEKIKAGDLVMVVHGMPCCGYEDECMGSIFIATEFNPADSSWECDQCGAPEVEGGWFGYWNGKSIDVSRLKRIPPLTVHDIQREDCEVCA